MSIVPRCSLHPDPASLGVAKAAFREVQGGEGWGGCPPREDAARRGPTPDGRREGRGLGAD
eukprot:scaffold88253_cov36-Phaeocystis_antarctica.AAC.1